MCPRPVSFVARYSAVPRIALASAKESLGLGGLVMRGSVEEMGEVERASGKVGVLVDEGDLAVFALVRRGGVGRGGVSEAI